MVMDSLSAKIGATHDIAVTGGARQHRSRGARRAHARSVTSRAAPESTGRERFGAAFAERLHSLVPGTAAPRRRLATAAGSRRDRSARR